MTTIFLSFNLSAQNQVQIFDLTGKGFDFAAKTARVNSKQNYLFLLIASDDETFTKFFTNLAELRAAEGYNKICVVLSDKHPSKEQNECILIAGGDRITTWEQMGRLTKDSNYYLMSVEIGAKIREVYKQFIK